MNYDRIGILIKYISNAITAGRNDDLKKIDLTAAQMDVLIYLLLNQGKEIHQRDIEQEFRIKNPTATGILKRLEEKRLITRIVNPNDERSKQIGVTDKARQMQVNIYKKGDMTERELVKGFSAKEERELRSLLQRVYKNLNGDHDEERN